MKKLIPIKIVKYRYNFDNPGEEDAYLALKALLKDRGLKLMDTISLNSSSHYHKFKNSIKEIEEVETDYLFADQYNTKSGKRIHEWSEEIFPNRSIKNGYYIDKSDGFDELKSLTASIMKCGYCNAQYMTPQIPKDGYCTKCLGSEHLTEDHYHLLALNPISLKWHNRLDVPLPPGIEDRIKEAQNISRKKRLEKEKVSKLKSLKKAIEFANHEYEVFLKLIELNIDYKKAILYSHSNVLNFRDIGTMSEAQVKTILKKLGSTNLKCEISFDGYNSDTIDEIRKSLLT